MVGQILDVPLPTNLDHQTITRVCISFTKCIANDEAALKVGELDRIRIGRSRLRCASIGMGWQHRNTCTVEVIILREFIYG